MEYTIKYLKGFVRIPSRYIRKEENSKSNSIQFVDYYNPKENLNSRLRWERKHSSTSRKGNQLRLL